VRDPKSWDIFQRGFASAPAGNTMGVGEGPKKHMIWIDGGRPPHGLPPFHRGRYWHYQRGLRGHGSPGPTKFRRLRDAKPLLVMHYRRVKTGGGIGRGSLIESISICLALTPFGVFVHGGGRAKKRGALIQRIDSRQDHVSFAFTETRLQDEIRDQASRTFGRRVAGRGYVVSGGR